MYVKLSFMVYGQRSKLLICLSINLVKLHINLLKLIKDTKSVTIKKSLFSRETETQRFDRPKYSKYFRGFFL